jgi:4-hydroxythreonine-4-phosphate dehydrogenase
MRIGFSAGDPNGIGIETIIRVFTDDRMFGEATPVVFATRDVFEAALEVTETDRPPAWSVVASAEDASDEQINVVSITDDPYVIQWGEVTAAAGAYAMKSLDAAVQALASTKVDVLVTAPIHKDAMQQSSFAFPGHTEYLQEVANVDEVLMLLVSGSLRIGVATGHIALKDVSATLSSKLIRSKVELMHSSLLRDFECPSPRIAVLGLNPHASDNGLMGDEEKNVIQPVIRDLASEGMQVYGPYAADGFFGSGAYRQFDGILAMYHDQGLAPFKTLSFGSGVNYTAGLPIVRTSPDHGTGMDIAGKGEANGSSMRAAVFLARDIRRHLVNFREYGTNPLKITQNPRREIRHRSHS